MLSHREGPPRACGRLSFEPDRGKTRCPESQGGRWKRGLWWNCEPTSLPKGRGWKPSTYGCAHQRSTQRGRLPVDLWISRAGDRLGSVPAGRSIAAAQGAPSAGNPASKRPKRARCGKPTHEDRRHGVFCGGVVSGYPPPRQRSGRCRPAVSGLVVGRRPVAQG